jgi:hypothetical protein
MLRNPRLGIGMLRNLILFKPVAQSCSRDVIGMLRNLTLFDGVNNNNIAILKFDVNRF